MGNDDKKGPVRPPVIDLTARPAQSRTAKTRPDGAKRPVPASSPPQKPVPAESNAAAPPPTAPNRPIRPAFAPLLFATLAGAVLGLVFAFGLAAAGLWPVAKPDPVDLGVPALAGLDARIADLETGQQAATTQFAGASELAALQGKIAGLDKTSGIDPTARASLLDLGTRLNNLAKATPPELADLSARLTRLEGAIGTATGSTTAPASQPPIIGPDPARLDRLSVDLLALSDRLNQMAGANEATNTQTNSQIATVKTDLAALADRLKVLDEPARLARIEAGRQAGFEAVKKLEEAMARGGAFADELKAVTGRLPALDVPEGLRANATTGLATVAGLRAALVEKMPGILRALAGEKTDASLLERLGDQLAAMVALRPDGAPEGDTPLARLARLETALERGEIIAARTQFLALPKAARAAAKEFGVQLAEAAAAAEWIGLARAALTTGNGALS